ncbi:retrotransposon protein, putative, ty1-copia subclass [Tanacetum coccineum]
MLYLGCETFIGLRTLKLDRHSWDKKPAYSILLKKLSSHKVLGIAPAAIIDRQLPFEYTITSRSTDVVVPIPPAPTADSATNVLAEWNAIYDAYNEVACLMLGNERICRPTGTSRLCATTRSHCWLILNGLTKDFAGFVRNYNMHDTGKTIGELHAILVEYEKGFTKRLKATRFREAKKLKQGALYLYVGNGVRAQVEDAIGSSGEYISQEFKDYLKACGIVQQLTPPYTPQHNGVSERRNRTLLDMVRSMMNLTTLPLSFWDYALESATRILNMVPTKKVDKTPYELWYGKVPNLSYLKVWGCEALVKRDTPDKLQQRSVKCIFIGYPKETMGYYFYFPPENKIVVARYAEFFEKNLITQEVSGRAVDLEEIQDEDTSLSKITSEIPMEVEGFEPPQEEVISIRRSERTHRAPNRLCLNVEVEEHCLGDINEPTSYKAAMLDSESNKWIDAMNAEIQCMMDNRVWFLVDLPPGCKTVGSNWIFKKKTEMDGIVHTYKARLVSKGYTQLYGVDYEEETFLTRR